MIITNEVPIIEELEKKYGYRIELDNYGSFLTAVSKTSAEYIKHILKARQSLEIEKSLTRNIVHTNPHLDEYFAELLLRSCLSSNLNIEFIEQALFSPNPEDDLSCQQFWPQAAVFGFGNVPFYGLHPLILLDAKNKTCSRVTIDYLQNNNQIVFSNSIKKVLDEIIMIDEFGNAHPQHIGNMIKVIHDVRFLFSKGPLPKDDIRDFLSPIWKRSLIDASIIAIIYCLENNIDLLSNPDSKKYHLQNSLDEYVGNSMHKDNPNFIKAYQQISNNCGNQTKVFDEALLKDKTGRTIRDRLGNNIPQLLILSRICFACYQCWEEKITKIIMTHLWELEFQKQINFLTFRNELEKTFSNINTNCNRTQLGLIQREVLSPIKINKEIIDKNTWKKKYIPGKAPLWIIGLQPAIDIFNVNAPTLNYLNEHNNGCGLILIENTYIGTKSLHKGKAILIEDWKNLVQSIMKIEPNFWSSQGSYIVNGNKAYRFVQRSTLDMSSLYKLAKEVIE